MGKINSILGIYRVQYLRPRLSDPGGRPSSTGACLTTVTRATFSFPPPDPACTCIRQRGDVRVCVLRGAAPPSVAAREQMIVGYILHKP